nr:receptor-like protein 12 [Tanacetum cinerariifolium]
MLASCKLQKVPDIKNHTRLMMLDLSVNELTGEIPSWIWQVGNGYLRFMNLSHNHFSGLQKPYTFPFLLDVLDLHSNELKGDIPVPPRRVYILDYSNNKFGSSIPVDFGNVLRSTLTFSISNSHVVGVIPESIRNASSLRVLDLSRNGLTGSIPLIGNLKDLQSLDLSVNKLTGRIPEQLTNLTSLSFLNVSYNHLSGRIPQGSRFQAFTELSYKGNAGLCGPPLKKSCGKRMS